MFILLKKKSYMHNISMLSWLSHHTTSQNISYINTILLRRLKNTNIIDRYGLGISVKHMHLESKMAVTAICGRNFFSRFNRIMIVYWIYMFSGKYSRMPMSIFPSTSTRLGCFIHEWRQCSYKFDIYMIYW